MKEVLFLVVAVIFGASKGESEGGPASGVEVLGSDTPTSYNSSLYTLLTTPQRTKGYQAVNYHVTWTEALILCKQRGMELATIRSKDEDDLFTEVVKQSGITHETSPLMWIGGAVLRNLPLGWFWQTDAQALVDGNWAAGEPNNAGGKEYCLSRYTENQGLNDCTCSETHAFACEYFH